MEGRSRRGSTISQPHEEHSRMKSCDCARGRGESQPGGPRGGPPSSRQSGAAQLETHPGTQTHVPARGRTHSRAPQGAGADPPSLRGRSRSCCAAFFPRSWHNPGESVWGRTRVWGGGRSARSRYLPSSYKSLDQQRRCLYLPVTFLLLQKTIGRLERNSIS